MTHSHFYLLDKFLVISPYKHSISVSLNSSKHKAAFAYFSLLVTKYCILFLTLSDFSLTPSFLLCFQDGLIRGSHSLSTRVVWMLVVHYKGKTNLIHISELRVLGWHFHFRGKLRCVTGLETKVSEGRKFEFCIALYIHPLIPIRMYAH